jgi:hypothetical protein
MGIAAVAGKSIIEEIGARFNREFAQAAPGKSFGEVWWGIVPRKSTKSGSNPTYQ